MIADSKNPVQKQMFVTTVKGNMEGFTKKEVEGAKQARILLHSSGFPSVQALKAMIRMNQWKNCDVTAQDVDNMVEIFGTDVAVLKGKTTQKKAPVVRDDVVEIPPELNSKLIWFYAWMLCM
jgi:hypothetical protein